MPLGTVDNRYKSHNISKNGPISSIRVLRKSTFLKKKGQKWPKMRVFEKVQKMLFFLLVILLSYHSSKICQVSAISIHSCPNLCTLLTLLKLYGTLAFDPLVSEIYPSAFFVVSYAWTNPASLKKIGEGHFRHWLRWLGMTPPLNKFPKYK